MSSFAAFIDLATTLGFITAPVFAVLNHRAMTNSEVPDAYRPSTSLVRWSAIGIAVLCAAGVTFLCLRLSA